MKKLMNRERIRRLRTNFLIFLSVLGPAIIAANVDNNGLQFEVIAADDVLVAVVNHH